MYTLTVTKYTFWGKRYNNKKFERATKHVPQISKVTQWMKQPGQHSE
jgi:hypothetical protein